ncbi:hypothetical protein MHYP_G00243410 [Metynnis hypsauchen]
MSKRLLVQIWPRLCLWSWWLEESIKGAQKRGGKEGDRSGEEQQRSSSKKLLKVRPGGVARVISPPSQVSPSGLPPLPVHLQAPPRTSLEGDFN